MCACASAPRALGQTPTGDSKVGSAKTKADSGTTKSKAHAKASAKSSRAGSSSAGKTHAASHPAAGTHSKSSTAAAVHASKSKYSSTRKSGKRKTTARGQQKIDPERAQAIQEALIRAHYLSGEVGGKWDQASEDAMRRYQADHGWQSKTVPDSRALISLGLGPSHDHLLNPESAMTTEPAAPRSETSIPVSHSADPGARVTPTPPVAPAPAAPPAHDSSSPQ
jgi:putative peptidoglycan binding protein